MYNQLQLNFNQLITDYNEDEEPVRKRIGPYSTFQMSNSRTPSSGNAQTPTTVERSRTPLNTENVQNALTPVNTAHEDILSRLHEVCKEVNAFGTQVRSEFWKDSRKSFNTVQKDTLHNFKEIHFEFELADMLLSTTQSALLTSQDDSFMSTMMRYVTNLQNLAFSLHPESTYGSARNIVHLLMQTTYILSRTLRESIQDKFYVEYYLLINCVYRYTSTPRLGRSGEGRRFYFKTRYL